VYRTTGQGIEVLVVHRPSYDDWSFPKGKRDEGETDLECALREVAEETGFRGEVGPELPSARYEVRGRPKVVRYWVLRQTGGYFEPNAEVDLVRWVDPGEAASLLSYDHDRTLLSAVGSLLAT
jgi:8-oxo-dGTP diphosphatase